MIWHLAGLGQKVVLLSECVSGRLQWATRFLFCVLAPPPPPTCQPVYHLGLPSLWLAKSGLFCYRTCYRIRRATWGLNTWCSLLYKRPTCFVLLCSVIFILGFLYFLVSGLHPARTSGLDRSGFSPTFRSFFVVILRLSNYRKRIRGVSAHLLTVTKFWDVAFAWETSWLPRSGFAVYIRQQEPSYVQHWL